MAGKIVKPVEQFELGVGASDVEFLHTYGPELGNEFMQVAETKSKNMNKPKISQ
jgi:hypothetical protein